MAEEIPHVTKASLKVALAVAAMLVCAIALFAFFTRNMVLPTVEILPMMNGFLCLVSGCVAFLAFGRFAVLHGALVRYEAWIPVLIDAGEFTPLFRVLTGVFVGLASGTGTIALIRRYARTGTRSMGTSRSAPLPSWALPF